MFVCWVCISNLEVEVCSNFWMRCVQLWFKGENKFRFGSNNSAGSRNLGTGGVNADRNQVPAYRVSLFATRLLLSYRPTRTGISPLPRLIESHGVHVRVHVRRFISERILEIGCGSACRFLLCVLFVCFLVRSVFVFTFVCVIICSAVHVSGAFTLRLRIF